MSKLIDLTGQRFGRLTVLYRAPGKPRSNGKYRTMWHCRCDCGNELDINGDSLKKGVSQSCGCYRKEVNRERLATHGQTDTRLYGIWLAMKRRCDLPTVHAYKDYGGRGISVCQEWQENFEAFYEWSYNHGYAENLSIDRIDNDGNYEPSNCQWVDNVAQANNRRTNRLVTINGETHNITQWAQILNKSPKLIFGRIYAGWAPERAVLT